jgi:site-specific recombinase XerD
VNDATKVYRVDRHQAEQFMARHLTALGGPQRSDYRFHRAALRRFLTDLCGANEASVGSQLLLSETRLLDWLGREARRRTTASAGCCFAAVSRYVQGLVQTGLLETDLMAAFQACYGNRGWPILAGALQTPEPLAALTRLRSQIPPLGPIALQAQRYLELHRATGKDYQPNRRLLTHLDRFLQAQGVDSLPAITAAVMERWVGTLAGNARTRFRKVRMAWRFFNYLLDLKDVTVNPTSSVLLDLGRQPSSSFQPFIFTTQQVAAILDRARQLPSNPQFPLRAETCSLIFALLYGLGLRMGEACRLRVRDLSLAEMTLFIDQTKFYKSRYVPFGPKLGSHLQEFVDLRRTRQPSLGDDDPLFVASGPGHVDKSGLNNTFRAIVDGLGIRGMPRQRAPRPHDLRHSCAVHRLLRWYREGADVQSKLPLLSTFLGHIDPTSTQVYVTMTMALLQEANTRFYRTFGHFFDSENDR